MYFNYIISMVARTRKAMNGAGFFGDVWSGIKSIGSKVIPFIKDNGLISKGLALSGNPVASGVASKLGFGKRRRVGRPKATRGKGLLGDLIGGLGRRKPRARKGRGELKGEGKKGDVSLVSSVHTHSRRKLAL